MATQSPLPGLDRYLVIHAHTTCDEHGVYVTKDSAEVIELAWILLDAKTCEEVSVTRPAVFAAPSLQSAIAIHASSHWLTWNFRSTAKACS